MKIFLESNWSEQFIYGDPTPGIFVGRKQEICSLKNIIKNNDSSTILVSSVRGVGKTSFIHKALTETENIIPIFVNIGHTLSNRDIEENKKLILKSLIRAIHFNQKFTKDKKLKELYEKSLGSFKEEKASVDEDTEKIGFVADIKLNSKSLIYLIGVFLITLGITFNHIHSRIILGFLGVSILVISFSWEKSIKNSFIQKKSTLIDDSTEFLEIEFENWLKSKNESNIVFVIDELDKIPEEKSFNIIKEYKNLFTRSFTHFIFIASQCAFDLVNEDREHGEKGIFPTFFTHTFYLSLPSSEEIKEYLNSIFINSNTHTETEKNELINYLLFSSGNDFFTLKRFILDIIQFDDDNPYIDSEEVKNNDTTFSSKVKLFERIDLWLLKENWSKLKINWKKNSEFQKNVFLFLKKNYPYNFLKSSILGNKTYEELVNFLVKIGHYKERSLDENDLKYYYDDDLSDEESLYYCTNKYNRIDVYAELTQEEQKFQNLFKNIIKIANDLDDLPEKYSTETFTNYDEIDKDKDGKELSGIDLYEKYIAYKNTYENLKEAKNRIAISTEEIKLANKILNEQVTNIFSKSFEILINLLNNHIFSGKQDLFLNQQLSEYPETLVTCPNIHEVLTGITHSIFGKNNNTRTLIILKDFSDYTSITEGLRNLIDQKNILIINLIKSDKYKKEFEKVEINYKDKLGRNRKKKVDVENFINFYFYNFRHYTEILSIAEKHLTQE